MKLSLIKRIIGLIAIVEGDDDIEIRHLLTDSRELAAHSDWKPEEVLFFAIKPATPPVLLSSNLPANQSYWYTYIPCHRAHNAHISQFRGKGTAFFWIVQEKVKLFQFKVLISFGKRSEVMESLGFRGKKSSPEGLLYQKLWIFITARKKASLSRSERLRTRVL